MRLESQINENLKLDTLKEFFEASGHNLVAFADIDARRHYKGLALLFGIDYEPYHFELADA